MNRSRHLLRSALLTLAALNVLPNAFATLADCGHRPFNADVPNADGNPNPRRQFREPYVEISNNPASPTPVTVYTVVKKFNNPFGTANQTGGTLFYKGGNDVAWQSISLGFHANEGDFQYWKASFSSSFFDANEVIQYYFQLTFDSGAENTYICAGTGFGDLASQTTNSNATAASNAFTVRNRPGWIFHANNRVINGNDVQFWAKVGYIGDANNLATRWATNGAIYYTTDGSAPNGSLGVPSGTTQALAFSYSHPESNNQGSQSIAGTPMWWVASAPNLLGTAPFGSTIKYRIGFWNTSNSEEKFAEHNAGTNNTTFTFTNGTAGDPALTVNGLNANYTTTHLFVDETKGDTRALQIVFQPGQSATEVEVYTNLNRRDRAQIDADGDGFEDGIQPVDGNLVVSTGPTSDAHYYKAYQMPGSGVGTYSLTLNASKTGAYRLTARWKVAGDPNWRWYTNSGAGRRDHALVVSPVDARNINLYEMNVLNVEASGDTFETRGTLEDLYNAPNAPHNSNDRWNLTYLKNLGCNWLWFQPIHPIALEGQSFDPGSPYAVRNFFAVNSLMSVNYDPSKTTFNGNPINPTVHPDNRAAALAAFKGFVSAADLAGVGVMLDAPFNHTAPDAELAAKGVELFSAGSAPTELIRDKEARFYSLSGNYGQRASNAGNIAIAPDRGDFGKWGDVRDVFFGNYSALVSINPQDNGNYNNESDVFDYTSSNWTSDDNAAAGLQNVTRNVWKYFAEYTLYWLDQTGVPAGTDLATQTASGIDGLRADFGQGLPPQFWEYAINKTRTRKWNFVFMAESLDGGAVTYRSNRHFDILNENIVFPLKSAGGASDYRNIFEGRRNAYGQSLVLLNNTSHDEESYDDPWQALVRYAVVSTVDGVPLIFPGQELGISRTFGYQQYEVNFGKQIAHFKRFNSMMPAWSDTNFGNDQLYSVYQGIGQARLFSPALRSPNRYFLNEDGNNQTIFGVAKYETRNGSPASSDVVFAFANTNRDLSPSGNFHLNADTDNDGVNDFGIKPGRTYDLKNIAAYLGFNVNRRNVFINRKTGAQLLTDGLFVAMNKVPTDNASWGTNPYEAQYLKVYDVTPPATAPGVPTLLQPNQYGYAINNGGVTYTWAAVPPDSEGIQPLYKVTYQMNNQQPGFFFTTGTSNTFQIVPGNTLTVFVQAINPNDVRDSSTPAGPSGGAVSFKVITPEGDEDGDGVSNSKEDAAGTNPFSASSIFTTTNVTLPDASTIQLTWQSVPGKIYRIEGAATPGGTYMPLGSQIPASSGATTTASVPTTGKNFFHVALVP